MSGLANIAGSILSQSQHRAEIIAQNLANATTPAYKRRIAFVRLLAGQPADAEQTPLATGIDSTPGKLVETGNRFDLAIAGPGVFALRQDDTLQFTRAGRFIRLEDGRLADARGGVLQNAAGGDLVVGSDATIERDGRIAGSAAEAGRVAIYETAEGYLAEDGRIAREAELVPPEDVHLVGGAYEASNVSTGEEMTQMMLALRLAESGQRVMLSYDDIMGRVITSLGDSMR